MTILLAVASSLMWGLADFLGGKASRRLKALLVVLVSQAVGLVAALLTAAVVRSFLDPQGYFLWGAGAGLAGGCAVVLFYRALAIGTMSVVAPLAALGVIVPVAMGLFRGTLPPVVTMVGIVVAIGGVVVTARGNSPCPRSPSDGRSIVLALGSALGFGLLQYAISGGFQYSAVMTMVVMRATSVPLLGLVTFLALRNGSRSGRAERTGRRLPVRLLTLVAVIGLLDVSGDLLFAFATVSGELAIVAVLGSLYPAVTVLLAKVTDHERPSRVQNFGVGVALAGVAMIAIGS